MTRNVAHLLESRADRNATARASISAFITMALVAFAVSLACAASVAPAAYADEASLAEARLTAYELQQQIEEAQSAYTAAHDEMEQIEGAISEVRDRVAQLEEDIPAQQERSSRAARELYKLQQDGVGLVDLLLSANSLDDFLTGVEYVNYLTDANIREMDRLAALYEEIEGEKAQLEQSYAEANARADEAQAAIDNLQVAQAEVQRRIEEEVRIAAEIAAQAEAQKANPRANDQGTVEDASGDKQNSDSNGNVAAEQQAEPAESEQPAAEPAQEEQPAAEPEPEPEPAPAPEPASSDEASFMAEWTARIDAYLAGSPLAGQGATFARAAYTYGVDPRWSPAISFTESGKGAACFLPHNAWGWGSCSWGSWEEAINDHVAGLSRGYGYTISLEAAQKYCPPNAQGWYDRTLGQMELI